MKLRNKKTGEVKNFVVVVANGYAGNDTLAELNEEWEDYEENQKDKLNALMDLELARKEAIHYIDMDTETFAVSKGCIEIRKRVNKK